MSDPSSRSSCTRPARTCGSAGSRRGKVPARVFDVQIAAGFVGFGYPLSLGNLISQTLGVSVFGGETRTDWRRRPLTPAQLRYALDDVRYLLPLADMLQARLEDSGREDWVEAELRDFLGDDPRPRRRVALAEVIRASTS